MIVRRKVRLLLSSGAWTSLRTQDGIDTKPVIAKKQSTHSRWNVAVEQRSSDFENSRQLRLGSEIRSVLGSDSEVSSESHDGLLL